MADQSARVSMGRLSVPPPEPSFSSMPWPHSWGETPSSSPVLPHVWSHGQKEFDGNVPVLKKCRLPTNQYALQTSFILTLSVTFPCSHVLDGKYVMAFILICVTFQYCVRDACVFPAPPKPGVVQSVPAPDPKSMTPAPFAEREMAPQSSVMCTPPALPRLPMLRPFNVDVPLMPGKSPM